MPRPRPRIGVIEPKRLLKARFGLEPTCLHGLHYAERRVRGGRVRRTRHRLPRLALRIGQRPRQCDAEDERHRAQLNDSSARLGKARIQTERKLKLVEGRPCVRACLFVITVGKRYKRIWRN